MPAITTAAIATFIGSGLAAAGWKAVEESALKPAMQPGVDRVKGFLESGPQRRKANKALRDAVEAAFTAIGAPEGAGDVSGYALRLGFGRLRGTGAAAAEEREMVARAALLMRSPDPTEIPDDVYEVLHWPREHRPELAQFLYALRQALADSEEWNSLVTYSEQEAVRHYLSLSIGIQERIEAMLAALLAYQGIASGDRDGEALASYLEFVRDRYRLLSFLFIKSVRRRNIKEAELDAVFVPLHVHDPERDGRAEQKINGSGRSPDRASGEMVHDKFTRPMTIDEVLAKYPVFVLRGKPGSGKSTILRYITLSFARNEAKERLDWPHENMLPILVPLSNFGRYLQTHPYHNNAPGPLSQFIETYFRDWDQRLPPDFFHNRLQKGRCLILLDGLDEVANRKLRADVAQIISAFIEHYDKRGNRFVLASRPKGYDDAAIFLPKPVVCTVQDMTPEGRDVLVRKLLRQFGESRRAQNAEIDNLLQDIRRKEKVDDLSRNPLFCTILVLVYKFLGARLPERRVDVYAEVVNLMLGSWELHRSRKEGAVGASKALLDDGTSRVYDDEKDAQEARERALVHVADRMQRAGKVEVSREWVQAELAQYYAEEEGATEAEKEAWAKGFLEIAHRHSGLYVAKESGTHAFSHRSFLEYLAATALIDQREEAMRGTILGHVGEKWWHDVIVLAAAHPDLKTKRRNWFFELLLQNDHIVLAGECAVDAGKRLPPPMRNKVLARLYAQMTDAALPPPERFAAGWQWDALGGPPPDVNAWLRCPACGDGKEDLLVGKYPVTNAQFALFMAADGYENAEFWDGEESAAWQWRLEKQPDYRGEGSVQMPEYWRDTKFGRERRGFPVVGVSWYEARAYCRWLTHLLAQVAAGDEMVAEEQRTLVADLAAAGTREVRLLKETEWERAAGGKQNSRYPWDKGIEVTDTKNTAIITARANVDESDIKQTTPAAMYPDGASPFGLQDMAGNVWEWTESFYDEDKDTYTVRGGSWDDYLGSARVAARYGGSPHFSRHDIGFRAVSPVVLSPDF